LRKRVIRGLSLLTFLLAVAWVIVSPSYESGITALVLLIGFISASWVTSGHLTEGEDAQAALKARQSSTDPPPPAPSPAAGTRIAVLPLQNITEAPGKEYFAEGLTEEIISVLSRISGLQVIAKSSVSQYRDRSRPIAEIGRELNVGAVLEGSVRSAGEELRVTVRLVDVASESHLWSADYDGELKEIFAVQRNIASEVARSLDVSVFGAEAARLEQVPTTDLEAYDLYLLGRHDLNKRTEEGLRRSIDRFRAAVEKDPSFAAAYAGIADAYVLATIGYASIPLPVAIREAREASTRALQAQETLSDAHTSRGWVLLNLDWDFTGAESEFKRALELNPSDVRAFQWFAQCFLYQGRFEEAIPFSQKAQELDPRSALIATEAGWPFQYLGRNAEALDQFKRASELEPGFPLSHFNVGNILESEGRTEEALAKYQRAVELSNGGPMYVAFKARALALLGRREEALRVVQEVAETALDGAPTSVYVAHVYDALGEVEEALTWLERAAERRESMILAINSPWMPFQTLRGMHRYENILSGLPVADRSGKPSGPQAASDQINGRDG
jgi:TolB-like protein/Tfp pilus assembly protein PilF